LDRASQFHKLYEIRMPDFSRS